MIATLYTPITAEKFESLASASINATPLSGVGDEAFYVPTTSTVNFRKGDKAVGMQAQIQQQSAAGLTQAQTDLVALAKVVAASL